MENDFNTAQAKAALFELVGLANEKIKQNQLTQVQAKEILEFLKKFDKIFLFLNFKKRDKAEIIPEEILALAKERESTRKEKNWQKADEIRRQIKRAGWLVEDTSTGPKLKKV